MSNGIRKPELIWREKLPLPELTAVDLRTLERELGLHLAGYLKPGESIVGYRILYEDDGYADLLLMRRNRDGLGFTIDLDVALGKVGGVEAENWHRIVHQTVSELISAHLKASVRQTTMQPSVFLSYEQADAKTAHHVAQALETAGVSVWRDRRELSPGQSWKSAIRQAIESGAGFVAIFSRNFESGVKGRMNEELKVAIDEIHARSTSYPWFFVVRLDHSPIPVEAIRGGEVLLNFKPIDLYDDFEVGEAQLTSAVLEWSSRR